MREADVERQLVTEVRRLGGMALKFVSPGFTGVPDRLILLPGGQVIFAELKAPGKTERPRQRLVHTILRKLGFTVFASVDSPEKVRAVTEECQRRIGL